MKRYSQILFVVTILFSFNYSLNAQEEPEEEKTRFLHQERMTGDWGGFRNKLTEKGITTDFEFAGYYQGLMAGDGYDDFDFGGRFDALVNFTKLWKGGAFYSHLTYGFGDMPGWRGGALWPASTGSILPLGGNDQLVASSLYFSQRFGASTSMLLGKINALDLLARDPFYGGWGNHRFMNLAFVAPPSGVVPPVIMGVIVNQQIKQYTLTFMIFDSEDRTKDYLPDDLFSKGINLSLGVTWAGNVFERSTKIGLSGTISTKEQVDFSQIVLPVNDTSGFKSGAFNIGLNFSYLLFESPAVPGQGLGVYGKVGIADGNPNPIRALFTGGLKGDGIVPGRPNDTFGVGYFIYDFGKDLKNVLEPLAKVEYEQGIEVFYSLAVAPWFHITADLQWIQPADRSKKNAWVGGLRANIKF